MLPQHNGYGDTYTTTYHPTYHLWINIKQRCHNPNYRDYHKYGARGITMHPEWRRSYAAFWRDIGCRPGPTYSLNRIHNDLGYVPGNVEWADAETQARNKRNSLTRETEKQLYDRERYQRIKLEKLNG